MTTKNYAPLIKQSVLLEKYSWLLQFERQDW